MRSRWDSRSGCLYVVGHPSAAEERVLVWSVVYSCRSIRDCLDDLVPRLVSKTEVKESSFLPVFSVRIRFKHSTFNPKLPTGWHYVHTRASSCQGQRASNPAARVCMHAQRHTTTTMRTNGIATSADKRSGCARLGLNNHIENLHVGMLEIRICITELCTVVRR